jgi:hypothetical protein
VLILLRANWQADGEILILPPRSTPCKDWEAAFAGTRLTWQISLICIPMEADSSTYWISWAKLIARVYDRSVITDLLPGGVQEAGGALLQGAEGAAALLEGQQAEGGRPHPLHLQAGGGEVGLSALTLELLHFLKRAGDPSTASRKSVPG